MSLRIERFRPSQAVSSWVPSNSAPAPQYVTTSLMFYLDAANSSSYPGTGSTWFDLSENNRNATLMNSPTYNASGWFTFNGTNHNGSFTKPHPDPTGQISCEFWYNNTSSAALNMLHKGYHYSTYFTDQNTWYWADNTYSYATFGARTVSNINQINVWKQIVITKDASNNVSIYKNGSLADTRTAFGSALTAYASATAFLTGYSNDDTIPTSGLLQGNLAIMRMYNIALSAAQVTQNFNAHKSRFGL